MKTLNHSLFSSLYVASKIIYHESIMNPISMMLTGDDEKKVLHSSYFFNEFVCIQYYNY